MSIFTNPASFALKQVADAACSSVGLKDAEQAINSALTALFKDESQRTMKALQGATEVRTRDF